MALANAPTYDVQRIRRDFPILAQQIHGRPLVYLDSAASAQKPLPVLDAMRRFQERDYANVHRGVYALSERATEAYEQARARLARFLNARSPAEIVFTSGATAAINLVAGSWAASNLKRGDRIVISAIEHHSNIVPWQLLRRRKSIVLKVAPVNDRGEVTIGQFKELPKDAREVVSGIVEIVTDGRNTAVEDSDTSTFAKPAPRTAGRYPP